MEPSSHPISSDTRFATDIAATRLGCVQPIMPNVEYPSSCMYWVICVVFPEPVSPTTTTMLFSRMTCMRSSRQPYTGRNSLCSFMVFSLANSDRATVLSFMWSPNLAPFLKSSSPSSLSGSSSASRSP